MFSVARNIPQAYYALRNGVWKKKEFKGVELSYKTLGIVGCGRIGQRLSRIVSGLETVSYTHLTLPTIYSV